jgi:hypothetical protein
MVKAPKRINILINPPAPAVRNPSAPTSVETLLKAKSSKRKKVRRDASGHQEIPPVSQEEFLDDTSNSSDESGMADSLRVEIAQLRSIVEKQDKELERQSLLLRDQRQEIDALKNICGIHDRHLQDIDTHLKSTPSTPPISPTPPPTYKAALQQSIPDLTSSIIKEQLERSKRLKNIVIRERNASESTSILATLKNPTADTVSWLRGLGASPEETANITVRVAPSRPMPTPTPPSRTIPSTNSTLIVSLPNLVDRNIFLAKLKKSLRNRSQEPSIFIDPDFTPSEAKEQYSLRQERNRLNCSRSVEEKTTFYFGIRGNKVIKILL